MTELAKTALFTYAEAPKETGLDNTTRIVRRITEDEAFVTRRQHLFAKPVFRVRWPHLMGGQKQFKCFDRLKKV